VCAKERTFGGWLKNSSFMLCSRTSGRPTACAVFLKCSSLFGSVEVMAIMMCLVVGANWWFLVRESESSGKKAGLCSLQRRAASYIYRAHA
jgi:hypothetical protein